ncbi:P-loop containing nucleoside triphosphate hydrolase protein [Cladochytrium replicatum]|nr:P-loop containing nucleoside triphosphate hydrolase protein [Cladochytrium replicatum]
MWLKPSLVKDFSVNVRNEVSLGRRINLLQIPKVCFKDLVGVDDVVKLLRDAIVNPLRAASRFPQSVKAPKGGILYGDTGVGKSTLAYALINELGFNCVQVEGSKIRSKIVGESEKAIARVFSQARATSPCIILIDQIDVLLHKSARQGGSSDSDARLVTTFLTVTTRISDVDQAIKRPGRLGEHVYVPRPTEVTRKAMLEHFLKGIPNSLKDSELNHFVARTDKFSGTITQQQSC